MFDTDILVDALRGFSAGLDHVEEAEQQGALRFSITTEWNSLSVAGIGGSCTDWNVS